MFQLICQLENEAIRGNFVDSGQRGRLLSIICGNLCNSSLHALAMAFEVGEFSESGEQLYLDRKINLSIPNKLCFAFCNKLAIAVEESLSLSLHS